jgi:hypothetical protein
LLNKKIAVGKLRTGAHSTQKKGGESERAKEREPSSRRAQEERHRRRLRNGMEITGYLNDFGRQQLFVFVLYQEAGAMRKVTKVTAEISAWLLFQSQWSIRRD